MQNQLGTELSVRKGTAVVSHRAMGQLLLAITCCAEGAEPPSPHSRESLGCLQPPGTAVLASLGLEIQPCGSAAEEEGM